MMGETQENLYDFQRYESLLNSPIRLAIISFLAGVGEADFTRLKKETGTTDGNLNRHLAKLEETGFIEVIKQFEGKKPVTIQRLTVMGRTALTQYVANLEKLISNVKE